MCSHWATFCIRNHISISMISCNQCYAAFCKNRFNNFTQTFVCCFNCFNRWLQHSGVTDHIRVSKVQE